MYIRDFSILLFFWGIIINAYGLNAPAAPTISANGSTTICAGETVTLTAANCSTQVVWNDGSTGATLTVANPGNYNAICRDASGDSPASNTISVTTQFTPPPIIGAAGPTTFCAGGSVTLEEQLTNNLCSGTLTWSNGATGTSIVVNSSGFYTATCENNGCTSDPSNAIEIIVNPIPNPPSVSGGGDFCSPTTSTTLTASGCAGTVIWSDNQTGNSITVNSSGNYNATCTVNGCTSGISGSVTVNFYNTPLQPIIGAAGPTTFCAGGSVTLEEQMTNSLCSGTLNWSNGAIGTSIVVNSSGFYTATCENNGCTSDPSNAIEIIVNPIPNPPSVSGGGDFCSPTTSTTLTASGCAGTVIWSDNQTGNSITVNSSGNYNATCTVNGCTSGISGSVTVNFYTTPNAPTIAAGGPTSFCSGSSVTLTASGCSGNVNWSNGATGATTTISTSGNYTATCETNGCVSGNSNAITITASPTPSPPTVSGGGDFCSPTTSTTLTASGCAGTVTWSDNQTGNSITVNSSGNYKATCTVNGCISPISGSATVNFYTTPNAPTIAAAGPTSFCSGSSVILTASGCSGNVNWSNGATGATTTISTSGSYTATCEVNGCDSGNSNAITITASPTPSPPTVSGGGDFCSPTTSTTLTASGCAGTVTWSDNQTGNSITVNSSGNYNATCTVNGCISPISGSATVNFYVTPSAPVVLAKSGTSLCTGSSVVLTTDDVVINCNGTIRWSNGQTAKEITVNAAGSYSAVCEENGCVSEVSNVIEITLLPELKFISETTDVSCFGFTNGLVNVFPTGGKGAPYFISWSDGNTNFTRSNLAVGTYNFKITDTNNCSIESSININGPVQPESSFNTQTISCNTAEDGKIFLQALGSNGGNKYSLNGGSFVPFKTPNNTTISNLASGSYSVVIKDANNCAMGSFNNIQFAEPKAISIDITETINPSGSETKDGTVTAVITGGTLPFKTIELKDDTGNSVPSTANSDLNASPVTSTIGGVDSGTYFVNVIDNNGCEQRSTEPATISAPPKLEVSLTTNQISCSGESSGSIIVAATGGVPATSGSPYTYEWSRFNEDGVRLILSSTTFELVDVPAGNYQVKVTDANNISVIEEATITEPIALNIELTENIADYCETSPKGRLRVNITGGNAPYQVNWSNGQSGVVATDLAAGTYSVNVTDNSSCDKESSFTVNNNKIAFGVNLFAIRPDCFGECEGRFVGQIVGDITPTTLEWDGYPEFNGQTELTDLCAPASTMLTVSDSLGCAVSSRFAIIDEPEPRQIFLPETLEVCPTDFELDGNPDSWIVSHEWLTPSGERLTRKTIPGQGIGTYVYTASDNNGCEASGSVQVISNTSVKVYITGPSQAPENDNVVFLNLTEPRSSSISWELPQAATLISENNESLVVNFNQQGDFQIAGFVNVNSCDYPLVREISIVDASEFDDGEFTPPLAIKNVSLKVFGNPVINERLEAEVISENIQHLTVRIIDLSNGRLMIEKKFDKSLRNHFTVNTRSLINPGSYLLYVLTGNGHQLTKKIVIK